MRGMVTSNGHHIIFQEENHVRSNTHFPSRSRKDPAAFFDAFLGDSKFDQVHNAMFALAHEAFLAGFQAAKATCFRYKGGQA